MSRVADPDTAVNPDEKVCILREVAIMATISLIILDMTMKTISAREAKNSFGQYLEMAQREPVIITKRNRPVAVTFSVEDLPAMMDFADQMRAKINTGIERGIADADAGRGHELNEEYVESLKQKLQARIANKKTA